MLIPDQENLALLVDEYRSFIHESANHEGKLDWDALIARLIAEGEWTVDGAHHLATLVREHGSFVLRSAAALAIAAEVEDGSLGM